MLNSGISATVVSQHISCILKTIKRVRGRFRVTGNVADCPRSCRPRVTTADGDRYIVPQQTSDCMCLTNISVILEVDSYVLSLDFFQLKNYRSDFKFSRHVSKE